MVETFFFEKDGPAEKGGVDFEIINFHPSITEFRIEEKIHTKAGVDMSRGSGRRIFLFFWERLGRG